MNIERYLSQENLNIIEEVSLKNGKWKILFDDNQSLVAMETIRAIKEIHFDSGILGILPSIPRKMEPRTFPLVLGMLSSTAGSWFT